MRRIERLMRLQALKARPRWLRPAMVDSLMADGNLISRPTPRTPTFEFVCVEGAVKEDKIAFCNSQWIGGAITMNEIQERTIPILIIVDCEPDLRETDPDRAEPWTGFERLSEFFSEQRNILTVRTGFPARLNWFWRMDPQIQVTYGSGNWPIATYKAQICEAKQSGDEFGLHVHAWRWDAALKRWIADLANDAWVEQCVRTSLEQFERSFGEPCRLFRFGDGWLSDAVVDLIDRLGVYIDLTMEPGRAGMPSLVPDELSTGDIPDRRKVPQRPYHPSTFDFRRADRGSTMRLWMLPVSTAEIPAPETRGHSFFSPSTWIKQLRRRTVQLNLGMEYEAFMSVFRKTLSSKDLSYVAICVQTDVGTHPYLMSQVKRNLSGILSHELADRFRFTVPTDALTRLTS